MASRLAGDYSACALRASSRKHACHFLEGQGGTVGALRPRMSKLLRGLAAGWGAKKLGGGCLSTILVFVVLWYLLGHFQIFR